MSRRLHLALLLGGAILLAFLLHRIGPTTLATDIARTGWWSIPIALLYLPVYALNTRTWQLILDDDEHNSRRPPFHRLFAITITGFAINYLTPVVSLGGEPYRAAAIAPWVGTGKATSSVIVFAILHALGNLLLWLSGIAAAILVLRPPLPATLALFALGALIAILAALLIVRLRDGGVVALVALLRRVPLLGRRAENLSTRIQVLEAVDLQIRTFYRRGRWPFLQALTLEYLARSLGTLEYWLIFLSLGLPLGPGHAFLIGASYSLLRNILFFVPFELGTREGGLYALMELITGDGGSGVATGIVSRIRELAWITVGLLLLWARVRAPAEHGS
jgi:hypothetical protein